MVISRNKETDTEKCTEISYMYRKYNELVGNLFRSEKNGEIDTKEVKGVLLDLQNEIHGDLIKIAMMEGVNV